MSPSSKSVFQPMPVSTMLTPDERLRVDAAGEGLYSALHRESLDEVLADLRERRAGAVLDLNREIWISQQCSNGSNGAGISREFQPWRC